MHIRNMATNICIVHTDKILTCYINFYHMIHLVSFIESDLSFETMHHCESDDNFKGVDLDIIVLSSKVNQFE